MLTTKDAILAGIRELATELGRTPMAKDWRASQRRPCFATVVNHLGGWDRAIEEAGLPPVELPGPGWQVAGGHRRWWTDERIAEALRLFKKVHGAVPSDGEYARLQKGDLRFPPAATVRRFGGGLWSEALRKARVPYNRLYDPWTQEDEDLLLELAGTVRLVDIAKRLKRSYAACKRRLYDLGSRARDAQGYLTAQQCAAQYNVPVTRVFALIKAGTLEAHKGPGGVYWQIDPDSAMHCAELTEPKRTHQEVPPDIGNYRQRYGLRRTKKATFHPTQWRAS